MPKSTDDTERAVVNKLNILMRACDLSDTPEGPYDLLISALAHHLAVQYGIEGEGDLEKVCESVKEELMRYVNTFIENPE